MCVNCLDNDTTLEAITREKEKRKKRKKHVSLSVRKNKLTLRAWSKKYSMKLKHCNVTVRD